MLENTDSQTVICSRLLTEELQLIRTCAGAIERLKGSPYESLIVTIHANHQKNAAELRNFVDYSGKAFLDMIPASPVAAGSLKSPVDLAALKTLAKGEKRAMAGYETALADPHGSDALRACISGKLIPRLQEHIVVLGILTPSGPEPCPSFESSPGLDVTP